MKPSTLALPTLLIVSASSSVTALIQSAFLPCESKTYAFTPSTSHIFPTLSCSRGYSVSKLSAYIGEDYDAIPPSASNNNRNNEDTTNEEEKVKEYVQKMSPEERKANLDIMKQIFTHDLGDLHRRRDYAGWVEAKRDLKRRESNDPWFELNTMMMEAVQMGEEDEAKKIQILIDKVGGPPPGVKHRREYAVLTEIYDTPMSISRAENIARADQAKRNREIWKHRIAQREANEKAAEEAYWNDPLREDREAEARRELFMKRVFKNVEEEKKKAMAKAEELLGENKDKLLAQNQIEKAWAVAKKEMEEKQLRQSQKSLETKGLPVTEDASKTSDYAILPPRRKVTKSENGRPRVPGDRDVTLGEIAVDHISETSDITTGYVRIKVNSSYYSQESDAAVRKHTFQYTVQITNSSPTETIQLTRRRFEIQTVGTSKKDLVEGVGVTGRQPILKPGETFSYTSLAPLNVRPLGTTIVAARMRGTYFYKILGAESTSNEELESGAELGTFHLVFPPEQRVVPFVGKYDDDGDDDDEDEAAEDMSNYI